MNDYIFQELIIQTMSRLRNCLILTNFTNFYESSIEFVVLIFVIFFCNEVLNPSLTRREVILPRNTYVNTV